MSQGYRECARRYDVVRAELEGLRRPFTVLDLGAHSGYFSFRLAEDFGARCTAVDDYLGLTKLAEQNNDPRVTVIRRRLGVSEVKALGGFDVVLALSVLHHVDHWRWMLATIRGLARSRVIVETPDPTEKLRVAKNRLALGAIDNGLQTLGRRIGQSTGVWERDCVRPIYALPGKKLVVPGWVFTGGGNHSTFAPRFSEQLSEVIGYSPFPGSLNIRTRGLDVHSALGPPAVDFQDESRPGRGRKGGDYQLWPASLGGIECHALVPGVRHHGTDTVEVVAPVHLRTELGLEDESEVALEVGA